jgi:signal transduction histidine kinase
MENSRTKQKAMEGVKPFRLVKNLSISSLIVIVMSTLLISGFISQRAKSILLSKSEKYALLVAENLNHQVFFQFTLPTLITDGEIRLSRESQYERLDKVVSNTIHGFSVERVNIYDPEGVLTYSTDPEKVGTKGDVEESLQRALREESVSYLVGGEGDFLGFEWKGGTRALKTYLPMWEERPLSLKRGKVLGVFEITQDVTHDYEIIQRFQWIVVLSFMAFVGVLFATILFVATRAERIAAARGEERQRLEAKLNQAERLAALGQMIAGVSHEIRNPLGIIRSTAELLHTRVENDRAKRLSSVIVEEASRLNGILTEFLDFARPKDLRVSPCRLEDILERNFVAMEAELQLRAVKIERDYICVDYVVEADCDLLYRAFVNLLSNAVQAMPEGGTLRVKTILRSSRGKPPQIELCIQDSGQGIPEDVRKKIFNPFFTTREKGTGLGLAIVQSIIDGHNGDIEVESKMGEGTTIILRLPLFQPRPDVEGQTTA